ncbi:WhiB family redox-sensing transcriptional regulator [Tamaricihabitans halophyticus]|uniref:Transcriptional regulator WhiB n=1 Tax=Tamaricihabitans halophyticus TaxID=1262583 RepID=A0A4V2SRP9_9PSEU|nr:WhiB family transcriptional regulator [Tamaricihabitans halophyticus]TCP43626.1 WhiB family redox-sensing transcriptional regulator [Tamaricihabitans halophyticus]
MSLPTVPRPREAWTDPQPAGVDLLTELANGLPDVDLEVPCRTGDPDLWFAEAPKDLERAKALCADCPFRTECLAGAIERQEPWGVWGGEIFERGRIVARKRPRGRPRKADVAASGAATKGTGSGNRKEAA